MKIDLFLFARTYLQQLATLTPLFGKVSASRRSRNRFHQSYFEHLETRVVFDASTLLLLEPITIDSQAPIAPPIINGTTTAQFPSVGMIGDVSSGPFCTGTLITSEFVLTAAHCAEGVNNTQGTFQLGTTTVGTSRVYIHPGYAGVLNDADSDNDIALYKLVSPITTVTPSPIFRGTPLIGQVLTLVGFGGGGTGNSGTNGDFGTKRVGQTAIDSMTPKLLRWSFDNNSESNTAPGDSGGPAFLNVGGVLQVAGVTSGGSLDSAGIGDNSFDTRVDAFQGWIDGIINGIVTPSAGAGDVVLTAFQSDTPDTFAFVATTTIAGSTELHFTDNPWDGTMLAGTEGTVTYTAPISGLLPGTKVVIQVASTAAASLVSGPGSVRIANTTGFGNSFALATAGDNILVYRGTPSDPQFVYAFSNVPFVASGPSGRTTVVPESLVVGTSAVALPAPENDNVRYNESLGIIGSANTIRALVSNPANWLRSDTIVAISNTNFTISTSATPTAISGGPYQATAGVAFLLSGSGSDADVGQILTYEWDLDYDGSTFTIDALGATPSVVISTSGVRTIALRVTDNGAPSSSAIASTTLNVNSTIASRSLFYRGTVFDTTINSQSAIDPTKVALISGQAKSNNYSNYVRGITGVIIDAVGLGNRTLTPSDFRFQIGNSNSPAQWPSLPTTALLANNPIRVLPGQGIGGSDRIKISFVDNSIIRTWLRIEILANANTGLANPDIFYFGNAVGDVVARQGIVRIDAVDENAIRLAISNRPVSVSRLEDLNKDGFISAADLLIVKRSYNSGNAVPLINVPFPPKVTRSNTIATAFQDISIASLDLAFTSFDFSDSKLKRKK